MSALERLMTDMQDLDDAGELDEFTGVTPEAFAAELKALRARAERAEAAIDRMCNCSYLRDAVDIAAEYKRTKGEQG